MLEIIVLIRELAAAGEFRFDTIMNITDKALYYPLKIKVKKI